MKKRKPLIRWLVLIVVLVLLVRYIRDNREAFAGILARTSWKYLLAMVCAQALDSLVQGGRMFLLVKEQGAKVRLIACLRIYEVSRFLGTFIPTSGLVYRGVALKEEAGFDYRDYVNTALAFSWFTLVSALMVSLALLLVVMKIPIELFGLDSRVLLAGVLLVFLAGPFAVNQFFKGLAQTREGKEVASLWGRIADASREVAALIFHPRITLQFLGLTALSFVLVGSALYLAFKNGGHAVDLAGIALLFAIFRMGAIVNLTPGNIGLLEMALGYMAGVYGFHPSVGVFAMLTIRLTGFVAMTLMAFMFGGKDALRQLKTGSASV